MPGSLSSPSLSRCPFLRETSPSSCSRPLRTTRGRTQYAGSDEATPHGRVFLVQVGASLLLSSPTGSLNPFRVCTLTSGSPVLPAPSQGAFACLAQLQALDPRVPLPPGIRPPRLPGVPWRTPSWVGVPLSRRSAPSGLGPSWAQSLPASRQDGGSLGHPEDAGISDVPRPELRGGCRQRWRQGGGSPQGQGRPLT